MALLPKLILTGAFVAAAGTFYVVNRDADAAPKTHAWNVIDESDGQLNKLGLEQTAPARVTAAEDGKTKAFCLDARKVADKTPVEACFNIPFGGHVKLASLAVK